ncbi:MAG: hypothetical protein JRF33_10585 [Deltaproteobacteria bacterium]|nr:hypothetical protein [Deltaproteobacteria bacterium]
MRLNLFALACLFVFAAAPAKAQGPIVAVFDMEDKGSGLASEVLGKLGDYLGVLLTKGGYQVMARSEIRERLKEQKKETYKSCYDQSCQIEMGRELAAEKTLATWILKVGETCQVTATLYDLKKGVTELAAIAEAPCEEGKLLVAVKALSDDLCRGLSVRSASTEEAEIKAAVARKEAEAARKDARQKAEELEKMRREAEAAKMRAEEAEAARLVATKKVEALEKTREVADAEELKKARLEAKEAKERADKAEVAKLAALKKAGDMEQARIETRLANERAEQAEREKEQAEKDKEQAEVAMREEKEKAEEALLEAEKARKNPEGLPTERFNLGIGFTFLSPDVTEMENDLHDHPDSSGMYEGGFGLAIKLDFMLTSYLSVGGYLAYTMGEFCDFDLPGDEDEYSTMHIMNALATVKGRFNLGTVEFRPGLAAGYQHHDGGPSGKVDGLGLSAFVETAFYLSRHFGLTLELGMNILPVSSGNEGDMTFLTPLLYITLGAEYCD